MAIIEKVQTGKRVIDLTGPQGNAFFLMGIAERWGRQLGLEVDKILENMQSEDYEHLILVFDKNFGSVCNLER